MRLALSLRRTLGEMAEMPGLEFQYWQEFMRTEPIGHHREDINFALLKKQIAGLAGNSGAKLDDFLIDWGAPVESEETTPVDYRAAFKNLMNG